MRSLLGKLGDVPRYMWLEWATGSSAISIRRVGDSQKQCYFNRATERVAKSVTIKRKIRLVHNQK